MNTLRGVFPEPPSIPKRNFIRENMIHIKRMQGYVVEDTNNTVTRNTAKKKNKNENFLDINQQNPRTMKLIRNTKKQLDGLTKMSSQEKTKTISNTVSDKNIPQKTITKPVSAHGAECPYYKTAVEVFKDTLDKHKIREIGVQTEQFYNVKQLYETGKIKYPSSKVMNSIAMAQDKSPDKARHSAEIKSPKHKGDGDNYKRKTEKSPDVKNNFADIVTVDKKHDFVRENAQITKSASLKSNLHKDPNMPPATYQKGVVPKYLRERKDLYSPIKNNEGDEKCPDGHVILPENERKETLRMLRQSYAELVTELNQLPVRSDTLKIRNRKIEIENQLKKLDEGIKVFTRPKVYVKIGV